MDNLVKNNSKGYGYNYASLGDIAMQGFAIPKMKTDTDQTTGKDYVYYKDGDEWIRGAEIVVPEGKSMNKAQLYGSALTYARRYTTLMALQLACDDDKKVEDLKADGTKKGVEDDLITPVNWKSLNTWFSKDEIKAMYEECGISNGKELKNDYAMKKIEERLKAQKKASEQDFYG